MTDEPNKPGAPHRHTATIGPERGGTSPFRVLFAIIPLLVILAVGTSLLLEWSTAPVGQRAARDERREPADRLRFDEEPFAPPAPAAPPTEEAEAAFDAGTILALLPDASLEDGARVFRFCTPCHTAEKDAPARVGPNLWGIVGRAKAAHPEYSYSAALRAKGGAWSYEDLVAYLHDPRQFVPGGSMAFAGISDNERMAALLAYLRMLADDPAPLPGHATQR